MRIAELPGPRLAILGAGREGASAARVLRERRPDLEITVLDEGQEGTAPEGVALRAGPGAFADLTGYACLVRSPGVSLYRSEIRRAVAAGCMLTSATRLWLAERAGERSVAVTGTKGKSTVASMLAHVLERSGQSSRLAGNIGLPLLDTLDAPAPELWVLELSSYQTCDLEQGPTASVLTSLYPEHLDWHGGAPRYFADKLRLLEVTAPGPRFVNAGDPECLARTGSLERRVLFAHPDGVHVRADGTLCDGTHALGDVGKLPLRGAHNRINLCAAAAAAKWAGVPVPQTLAALDDFRALPHRLETCAEVRGVEFVDDSLATVPQSVLAAVDCFAGRPLALIVGGRDRDVPYEELVRALRRRAVVAVVGEGAAGRRIVRSLREHQQDPGGPSGPRALEAPDLAAAVRLAFEALTPGGVVLFSPAAPTGPPFRSFEERSRVFRETAGALGADAPGPSR